MSRYFFHVHDGEDDLDLIGTELPDIAAARSEAARFASGLLRDSATGFGDCSDWRMRITDSADLTLFELIFFAVGGAASFSK
ncbi:DUF6894 family protein [Sphingomonas phyllosphaerae]|uniref:DUF6894 family protein n=1 Tax=Sphingomonas phyllosphaerae TaxID=257003 RepID=UPI00040EB93C|nr:hypothetical protein [Sphingomonas phyllosphaerae]